MPLNERQRLVLNRLLGRHRSCSRSSRNSSKESRERTVQQRQRSCPRRLAALKEHDEIRLKWREQIERGWLEPQAGQVVDRTDWPLKFWSVYSYLVVYDPESQPLTIVAVLHGARDIERLLKRKQARRFVAA